jgi:hypothetical protein
VYSSFAAASFSAAFRRSASVVAASWLELKEGSAVTAAVAAAGAASSGAASVNHVTDEAIAAASFSAVFWIIASVLCE